MKILALSLLILTNFCFAQVIVFVNQKGETLNHLEIDISIPQKQFDEYKSSGHAFNLIKDTVNPHISIHVHSNGCLKEYYNEYTVKQFLKIDTVVLYEDCLIRDYLPRIFLENFDSWLEDTLEYSWFEDCLKEVDFENSDSYIEILVFSSYKNIRSKESAIIKLKPRIAKVFGISEDKIKFKFTQETYVSRDTDLFLPGKNIDVKFIKQQNTKSMREYANNFRVVGVVQLVNNKSD